MPRCRESLKELRQLMLGFDIDPAGTTRLLAEWRQFCEPADSEEIRQCEIEILNIFVDICSLFQREPEVDDHTARGRSQRGGLLFSYLAHARDAR